MWWRGLDSSGWKHENSAASFEHGNEPSGSTKCGRISWLAAELLASHDDRAASRQVFELGSVTALRTAKNTWRITGVEQWRSDTDRVTLKCSDTKSSVTYVTTNRTLTTLESNTGLPSGRPPTNRGSHGTSPVVALSVHLQATEKTNFKFIKSQQRGEYYKLWNS